MNVIQKFEYHEKLTSESETYILYSFITHRVFQDFISCNFDGYGLKKMKTLNFVIQTFLTLTEVNIGNS